MDDKDFTRAQLARLQHALDVADNAFWNAICHHLPEISSGDEYPFQFEVLRDYQRSAVIEFYLQNTTPTIPAVPADLAEYAFDSVLGDFLHDVKAAGFTVERDGAYLVVKAGVMVDCRGENVCYISNARKTVHTKDVPYVVGLLKYHNMKYDVI